MLVKVQSLTVLWWVDRQGFPLPVFPVWIDTPLQELVKVQESTSEYVAPMKYTPCWTLLKVQLLMVIPVRGVEPG